MTESQPIQPFLDGLRHLHVAATPSTNDLCLELVREGDPGNLWVTTDNQTKGKGSRGRGWDTGSGNLFASYCFYVPLSTDVFTLSSLAFAASLALANAIKTLADPNAHVISVKWPNDAMINRKKFAGILLENHVLRDRRLVIAGFGVNCVWHPQNTNHPATDFLSEGIRTDASAFHALLARELDCVLREWDAGRNFASIRKQWLDIAAGIGREIRVSIPGKIDLTGIFETIDQQGLLVLRHGDGTQTKVSAGDVFFPTGS